MPSVYDLKPRFQALLRPLVGGLACAGACTPNHVTVAALLGLWRSAARCRLARQRPLLLLLLPAWLFVRMALNAMDGMAGARARHALRRWARC